MVADILCDKRQHIFIYEDGGQLVFSCVLVLAESLTHTARPYALIDNMITDKNHRGCGYATRFTKHACGLAKEYGCYKVMLMTGAKRVRCVFTSVRALIETRKPRLSNGFDKKNVTE